MTSNNKNNLPLNSTSVKILVIGILTMFIGFFVMTLDKEPFGFGFLGITFGPLLVLIGVIVPIFSLFSKNSND